MQCSTELLTRSTASAALPDSVERLTVVPNFQRRTNQTQCRYLVSVRSKLSYSTHNTSHLTSTSQATRLSRAAAAAMCTTSLRRFDIRHSVSHFRLHYILSQLTFVMADADHAADSTPPVSTSPPEAADAEDADADDYRNVWLKIWNNSSNPSKASCRIAFDILYYCYSPANQLRTLYRTGEPDLCHKAMEDVKLCARIRAGKLTTQEARVGRTAHTPLEQHTRRPTRHACPHTHPHSRAGHGRLLLTLFSSVWLCRLLYEPVATLS